MIYIIDRIENEIAVCESLNSGEKLEIGIANLPKNAKEGDAITKDGDIYTINYDLTKQRKAEMRERLNRLFQKHKPQ